jgi:hypothetical protein
MSDLNGLAKEICDALENASRPTYAHREIERRYLALVDGKPRDDWQLRILRRRARSDYVADLLRDRLGANNLLPEPVEGEITAIDPGDRMFRVVYQINDTLGSSWFPIPDGPLVPRVNDLVTIIPASLIPGSIRPRPVPEPERPKLPGVWMLREVDTNQWATMPNEPFLACLGSEGAALLMSGDIRRLSGIETIPVRVLPPHEESR